MADPTEGSTRKTAAALLFVVFVLGAVSGAALFYLGQQSVAAPHRPARTDGPPPAHPMARLTRDLDLDAEQQAAIRAILEEQRSQLKSFLDGSRAQIREVLRPDQQGLFDRMRPADPTHPGGPPPPDHLPPPPGHRPPRPAGHPPPPPPP